MALKCKNCGKINSQNNKFCDGCGSSDLENTFKPQKKKKGVIRYIIGIIVILLGISAVTNSNFITGITLILTGASLLPVIYDTLFSSLLVKNKFFSNLHVILPIVFFLSFALLNPIDDKIRDNREYKEKMSEFKKFNWPSSEIGKLVSEPKSKKGKIIWENSDGFNIEVSETTFDDYNDYIEDCKNKGFVVDYSKGDDYYRASNDNEFKVSLSYDENDKIMKIVVEKKKEKEPIETGNQVEVEKPNNSTGVTTSVKEFLDSYESVTNEYIDFMKKYKSSNNSVSMIGDYMKILNKYTDMADKASKMDQSEFTDEDLKYYLEVTGRITKKLLELGE